MRKIALIIGLLLVGLNSNAQNVEMFSYMHTNMKNFWEQNGKYEEKVLEIGTKIINANKLDRRVPIQLENTPKVINASSNLFNKTVRISSGILPYIDNDDEMAFVIGHEIAHAIDAYDGPVKWVVMKINTREYEYKADLIGIDLMAKAGYNPVAAITCTNKWMQEDPFDLILTHPVTSKRLMAMYKYIYVKYPDALKSDMAHNVNYENFTYSSKKEINKFITKQKQKSSNNEELL